MNAHLNTSHRLPALPRFTRPVPPGELSAPALRSLFAPVTPALDRAGVKVLMLEDGPAREDQLPARQFELQWPNGTSLCGDASCRFTEVGDVHWHLYLSDRQTSSEVHLLAHLMMGRYDGDHEDLRLIATHPLLPLIGLRGIQEDRHGRAVLTDGAVVPRLTGLPGRPLAHVGQEENHDHLCWMTPGQLAALQTTPGWTPRAWDGQVLSADRAAEIYTSGEQIILNGTLLSEQGAERVASLLGPA